MTEQLISFETAKLAKEKGFGIPISYTNLYFNKEGIIHPFMWFASKDLADPIHAVTQSFLQRWLREIYKIEVLVYCNASGWMWDLNKAFYITWLSGGTFIVGSNYSGPNDSGEWITYEEALEDGLKAALNIL